MPFATKVENEDNSKENARQPVVCKGHCAAVPEDNSEENARQPVVCKAHCAAVPSLR